MKTLKSGLFFLLVLAASLFTVPSYANNIVEVSPSKEVRQQLATLIQNPNLAEHGLSEAELFLKFTINEAGEIQLLSINTESEYLVEFAKEKLHHQKIDYVDVPPNTVYNLRIKFELQ